MWIIRRLKALGASEADMLKVLRAQVLSHLHFASPAWSTLITSHENTQIKALLRTELFLVFGQRHQSFNWALREAKILTLKQQRSKEFEKFTKNCLKSPKFSTWFVKTKKTDQINTRRDKPRFKPVPARTRAFARSAIPQMIL